MLRFPALVAVLGLLAAASPALRPPPNNPPGWDDIDNAALVISPVDPMDSTSLKLVVSTGYNFDDDTNPTLLSNLTVKAEVRTTMPPLGFSQLQDWFDHAAQPVTWQLLAAPVPHELMTILVTGLQPGTSYCFGIQGTDYANYQSLLDTRNVALGSTTADTIKPDPINPSEVQVGTTTWASVSLSVITPGDDAPYLGQATSMEFRFSEAPPGADLNAWYAQIPSAGRRGFYPGPAHLPQSVVIDGLAPGTTYFCSGRAADETGQLGNLVGSFSFTTATGQTEASLGKKPPSLCSAATASSAPIFLAAILGLLARRRN